MSAIASLLPSFVAEPLRYARHALPRRLAVAMHPARYNSDRPLDYFIIGLQKSGTQWLTALLDSHPQVNAIPPRPVRGTKSILAEGHLFDSLAEPKQFRRIYARLHGGFYRDLAYEYGRVDPDRFKQRMRRRFNAFYDSQRKKQLVGDKTTEYVFHLQALDDYYPSAKKICLLRDPRDRVVSFHYQQIRKGRIAAAAISDAEVDAYCARVEAEYDALVAYAGPPIHLFTYEDMKNDTATAVAGVLAFLAVDHGADTLASVIRQSSFEALSGRQPGESNEMSHFRKGVVGDWRHDLTPTQSRHIVARLSEPTRALATRYELGLDGYLAD